MGFAVNHVSAAEMVAYDFGVRSERGEDAGGNWSDVCGQFNG